MKFDNAFQTKAGNVGLQYKDKGQILTVYKDQHGEIILSEEATPQQKEQLQTNYIRYANRYGT